MSSSCRFLQMVTRTKKIFVGGLSANTVVEDVKQYFEQFGKVSDCMGWRSCTCSVLRKGCRGHCLCHSCVLKNLVLELGHQDLSEISAGAEMEEPGLWLAWRPVCLQEQTEWPLSAVVLAFVGHVGSGLGAGGGSSWGGMQD